MPDSLPPNPLPALPSTPNGFEAARRYDLDADTLFEKLPDIVSGVRGWRIGKPQSIESSGDQRRLYAPFRVGLFLDDVLMAVEALPDGGAALYLRSTSRVGYSDLGTNRRRITALLDAIDRSVRAS